MHSILLFNIDDLIEKAAFLTAIIAFSVFIIPVILIAITTALTTLWQQHGFLHGMLIAGSLVFVFARLLAIYDALLGG